MSVSVLCRLDISVSFFTWFPSSPTSIWGETLSRITCTVLSTSFNRPKEIGNKTGGSCDVARLLVDSNVPYWMTNESAMMVCKCQKIPDTSIITHRLSSARNTQGSRGWQGWWWESIWDIIDNFLSQISLQVQSLIIWDMKARYHWERLVLSMKSKIYLWQGMYW